MKTQWEVWWQEEEDHSDYCQETQPIKKQKGPAGNERAAELQSEYDDIYKYPTADVLISDNLW